MEPTGTPENRSKIANLAKEIINCWEMMNLVLARRISRKKVVTKATPVGGGTEAERASKNKSHTFASLRGGTSRDKKITRGNLHYHHQLLTKGNADCVIGQHY